eukprot:comp17694_c0_seq1/m.17566 comp17694_c0_seq1/g.17566  ORF comp17694_c0_seq1/g.17566 comp17694_c0_seq1/m.17566 type:complete len:166 (-) comp17694_c0_seq1:27-524(-)
MAPVGTTKSEKVAESPLGSSAAAGTKTTGITLLDMDNARMDRFGEVIREGLSSMGEQMSAFGTEVREALTDASGEMSRAIGSSALTIGLLTLYGRQQMQGRDAQQYLLFFGVSMPKDGADTKKQAAQATPTHSKTRASSGSGLGVPPTPFSATGAQGVQRGDGGL